MINTINMINTTVNITANTARKINSEKKYETNTRRANTKARINMIKTNIEEGKRKGNVRRKRYCFMYCKE